MKNKKPKKTKIEIATPEEVSEYGREPAGPRPAEATGGSPAQPPEASGTAAPAEPVAQEVAEPETDLQRAERERDEFRDKCLRAKAEVQNQARRLRAERDEAVRFAVADFARSLLNVIDDLERTLEAARTAVEVPEKDADAAPLAEGVRIVYDHLLKILSDHHVERIEAVGEPFDPTCHEAMTQQPSVDHPKGTVLQEVRKGYRLHERVLRPARVIVSCEPPPSEPEGEAAQGKEEPDDNKE